MTDIPFPLIDESTRWGLRLDEIEHLAQRLDVFFDKFQGSFRTKTHDKSAYAYDYVSGLLRLEQNRNMAAIARRTGRVEQNTQHFMSNSPWSGPGLIINIQRDIKQHPEFQGGAMLVIDESADQKAGPWSAGAGRQHNGRLGKVEMSQVGVFAALVTPRVNTWIDGELFFPAHWFEADYGTQRQKAGFPTGRTFQTKPELAWDLIQRAQANGVPSRSRKSRLRKQRAGPLET